MRKLWAAALVGSCAAVVVTGLVVPAGSRRPPVRTGAVAAANAASTSTAMTSTTSTSTTTTVPVPTTPAPTTTTSSTVPAALTNVHEAGCPVPPQPPAPPSPPPWHPAVLVPDKSLPAVVGPRAWHADLGAVAGKGMWIWEWSQTDAGDAAAIVAQAVGAGLHQVWVRVGDSKDGFYGASELEALVPLAHAHGLSVIAWGFPYLYDPVGDAKWTEQVLDWRDPRGEQVDGYSADIELASEGVDLTSLRAAVYLEEVRKAAASRPVIATVYPPLDEYWSASKVPYATIARYVDAFAPMIYWECTDPGTDAAADVARLATLRPVDIIGQAYNMADEQGRAASPSADEITEFLQAGHKAGAIGASFWVWQSATPEEWAAVKAFRWSATG